MSKRMDHKEEYEARVKAWIEKVLVQDVDGYWYAFVHGDGGAWDEGMVVRLLEEMSTRNAATTEHHEKAFTEPKESLATEPWLPVRLALASALGWPGGISHDPPPIEALLRMVAALRVKRDNYRTSLLRDAEQMFGWTEAETAMQLPRMAVLLDLDGQGEA